MKIFFDSTQLVHWEGNITGIPRIMNELAIRLHKDDSMDVVFVSWVKSQGSLMHLDFEHSIVNRGRGIKYVSDDELSTENKISTNISSQVKKSVLAKKVVKKSLAVASRVHPSVSRRIEARAVEIQMRGIVSAKPQAGDIIFIVWGEWWDDIFIEYLKNQEKAGVRIVQVINDLLPLSDPQFSGHSTIPLGKYCEAILPISSLVLCISEYTKNDTIQWLKSKNLRVPEVAFFRLGDDFQSKETKRPDFTFEQAKYIKPGEYILSVGTLEARKNFSLFYYSYKLAISKGITLPPLVQVGRRGWKTENIYDIVTEDPQMKDKIFLMGGVSDEELAWYYKNCKFLAHPSFCEGWGLQIAESAMNGKPVITSKTTSMPEVIGDRAIYINPFSSDELLVALQKMNDKSFYAAQKKKVTNYKPVSWDETYRQVKKFMSKLLEDK